MRIYQMFLLMSAISLISSEKSSTRLQQKARELHLIITIPKFNSYLDHQNYQCFKKKENQCKKVLLVGWVGIVSSWVIWQLVQKANNVT